MNCKFCPECRSPLPHAQNVPRKEDERAPLTTVQQSDALTGNRDQAERNGQSRGNVILGLFIVDISCVSHGCR